MPLLIDGKAAPSGRIIRAISEQLASLRVSIPRNCTGVCVMIELVRFQERAAEGASEAAITLMALMFAVFSLAAYLS